ncbi:ATP-dependent helicase dcl2-2 [Penicillium pulvis]|uniref:ATP-dependent helicase dcl2-2 n=1 Tax=Penicillium pulvis TaxID=1562058 RepID=UPI002547F3CB|nr:ATP-dependent helicase dcl2-2 [Penicillium pulvis]KAJ5814097.1 ATP-dependent helicase dcl2-2 [Penicillium pulvis]
MPPNRKENQQLKERAYQLEMLQASLQQNIIVAMGTGTGKTLIAILRIREALNMSPDKLVWFLCPTIALCKQQAEALRSHLPSSRARSFTGKDQVDRWGEKAIWDAALAGVRVAVSTHQVLLDALTHGFVNMGQFSLLVFDEAHHCTKNSPANKIMTIFYHPYKQMSALPRILGLSASPGNSDVSSLQELEINLDSRCMAPNRHYKELLDFTNRPEIRICCFLDGGWLCKTTEPQLLSRLRDMVERASESHHASKTSQLRRFLRRSEALYHELGSWAVAEYMFTSIRHFKEHQRSHAETSWSPHAVKDFTMQMVCDLGCLEQPQLPIVPADLSPKCRELLETLSRLADCDFHGLIFVDQRATVIILKSLIERYPGIKYPLRCGTFIGMSSIHGRRDLDISHAEIHGQEETLAKFRMRALDLIITTNVMEEGIDIPACNTVISFDRPRSIRSFVQRRGRARQGKSTFIIFPDDEQDEEELKKLIEAEDGLEKAYRDDTRAVSNLPCEAESYPSLVVERTGAQLGMLDSASHLNIFCAKILKQPYTINRPIYRYQERPNHQIRATVLLPSALHPSLQEIDGLSWWSSRKLANADAALQAYKALRAAGLVNDHLLPTKPADLVDSALLSCKGFHLLPEPINPWAELAARWDSGEVSLYAHRLQIQHPRKDILELVIIIPLQINMQARFPLFVDDKTTTMVHLWPGSLVAADIQTRTLYRQVTHLILQSVHGGLLQYNHQMDFVALFVPDSAPTAMQAFLDAFSGSLRLNEALKTVHRTCGPGLLRDSTRPLYPWIMNPWPSDHSCGIEELQGHIYPLPRRRNFLSRCPPGGSTSAYPAPTHEAKKTVLNDQSLTVDCLPFRWAELALYIPSITHEIGTHMVAEQLREKVLSGMEFHRIGLLSLAIQPTCSERPARFRSLAFVGATFLKYIISEQLFLHHYAWHEGLLSKVKEAVISDCGLAQAAKMCGLGRFLITRRFSGKKWESIWISSLLSPRSFAEPRKVSTRTLAEMVRAIVGAAYVDGGSKQAADCAAAIIPAIKTWHAAALSDGSFEQIRRSSMVSYPLALGETEKLLGYTFTDRSLLVEALTHPSHYGSGLTRTSAYGRLSFLGDAVLELVVTQTLLYAPKRTLEVDRLQSLRAAVTNHLFLTFLCLEFHLDINAEGDVSLPTLSRTVEPQDEVYLWTFLQSHSHELTTALGTFRSASRHDCWKIQRAFLRNERYPWAELAAMSGHNVLSDIVKSVIGAVFVDSRASLRDCQRLVGRLGILSRVKQLLRNSVVTDHPTVLLHKLYPEAKIFFQSYTTPTLENKFCCAVWLNDEKTVDCTGYPSREAAMIFASQAIARLHQESLKASNGQEI